MVKDDHQKVAVEMNWKQWAEHSSLSDTELKDFLLDVFDTTRCLFLGEHEPDEMTEENLEIPDCLFRYSTRQHVQLFIRYFNFKRSPAQIQFKWHNFEKWSRCEQVLAPLHRPLLFLIDADILKSNHAFGNEEMEIDKV